MLSTVEFQVAPRRAEPSCSPCFLSGSSRGAITTPVHTNQVRRAKKVSYGGAILFVTLRIVIWADELREAALVLSAFAVAIVLSTKELIMCVTGWWLKLAGGHFRIGDRVQIGSTTGMYWTMAC